jgi:hypothetical protein
MSRERNHLFLHSTAIPLSSSAYQVTPTANFAHVMKTPGVNITFPHDEIIEESYESPFPKNDRSVRTTNAPSSVTLRLVGDVVVAVSVTALAAPFLTIIDKALVQRAAALANPSNAPSVTVWSSMRSTWSHMIRHPIQFARSPTYLWMWGTYAVTYAAANTLRTLVPTGSTESYRNEALRGTHRTLASRLDTTADSQRRRPLQVWWSGGAALLLGTSIVNSSASVLKDRAYARLYGNSSTVTNNVPKITYGLWILRDLTVIGAAFVMPNHVARFWQQQYNNHASEYGYRPSDASILRISQIATPVAAQVIAGPLHFIGLDYYNRSLSHIPSLRQRLLDRWLCLRGSLGQVITARMMRIVPGYGIAGVLNTELRNQWEAKVVVPSSLSNNIEWGQRKNGYRVGS